MRDKKEPQGSVPCGLLNNIILVDKILFGVQHYLYGTGKKPLSRLMPTAPLSREPTVCGFSFFELHTASIR